MKNMKRCNYFLRGVNYLENKKSVLLLQKEYVEMINDLKKIKISLPSKENSNAQFDNSQFGISGKLKILEDITKTNVIKPEIKYITNRNVFAYDESIAKYKCLEGTGYHTAHALVGLSENDYVPCGLLTFYFYTSSQLIANQASFIKLTDDYEMESKKDYIKDRIQFLLDNVPPNSLLLIDGPLIAGDVYTYLIQSIDDFHKKNIIPVFFVKNSNSNMVIDNVPGYGTKFNSDMHWSYELLKSGERSAFLKYTDTNNASNSKVFCYFKAFDKSPQRIEFNSSTYERYENEIDEILNLIYYFLLSQGDKNPQVRPIAIAEKYAREYIRISSIDDKFFNYGFVPTMNQERFG